MKLYRVQTAVKEYSGCRNVVFKWFREDAPAERRNYAKLIENFNPADRFAADAEGFIDALFAKDEALQLKEYRPRARRRGADDDQGDARPYPKQHDGLPRLGCWRR